MEFLNIVKKGYLRKALNIVPVRNTISIIYKFRVYLTLINYFPDSPICEWMLREIDHCVSPQAL